MDQPSPVFRRRDLLRSAGALTVASLPILACAQQQPPASGRGRLIAGTTCPVTPRQTEGPFYFDPRLVRQGIAEGRPGIPLRLRLQVVDAADCTPSQKARVDIWHCDAGGTYSGYDGERSSAETYLRGTQFGDAAGVVAFETIYPGWYSGRAPHIHCKVRMPDGREVTSQVYFPDELSDQLYGGAAYSGRRGRWVRNEDDGIFRRLRGSAPRVEMSRASNGYEGAVVIALS